MDGDLLRAVFFLVLGATGGGRAARRVGQPAVLGELLAGIVLGPAVFNALEPTHVLELIGDAGIISFLFIVGVETDIQELSRVGRSATFVALLGAVGSFAVGVGAMLAVGGTGMEAAFTGGVLTATSVGVTAQVLGERGVLRTGMGRTILGAAVVDDVIGLVVLAVIVAMSDGALSAGSLALLGARLVGFGVLFVLVARLVERLLPSRRHRVAAGALATLVVGLVAAAAAAGLAPIVGAFAAGLVLPSPGGHDPLEGSLESEGLEEAAVEPPSLRLHHRSHRSVAPIVRVAESVAIRFAPVFFVVVGARVAPGEGWDVRIVAVAVLFAAVGVAGKLASGLGAEVGSRLAVGVAMIPRGEVGLVFAAAGLEAAVFGPDDYGALVLAVAATTLLGPLLLGRVLRPAAPAQS